MKVDIEMTQEELNKVTELTRPAQVNPVLELLLMMATMPKPGEASENRADGKNPDMTGKGLANSNTDREETKEKEWEKEVLGREELDVLVNCIGAKIMSKGIFFSAEKIGIVIGTLLNEGLLDVKKARIYIKR